MARYINIRICVLLLLLVAWIADIA
eukprot:COSAG06_NODE_46751_length_344_cov_1.048980_1_plen_24_part_10